MVRWPCQAHLLIPSSPLETCWGHLSLLFRPSGAILGTSWGLLGSSWALWKASSAHLGAILGYLGAILVVSGAFGGHLGAILVVLGPIWDGLGQSWGELGAILGLSWAVLSSYSNLRLTLLLLPLSILPLVLLLW